MTFHIVIQQERRTPRQTQLGEDRSRLAFDISEQLHTMSEAALPVNLDDPQFVGVFEWDLRSPYVIQHKGDYSAVTMRFAGWPELTKEQYDALAAVDPV